MVAFVVDAPVPVCFVTGLDHSGMSAFVASAVQHGASIEVHDDSPWIMTL